MDILTNHHAASREAQVRRLLDEFKLSQTHFNALKLANAHQPYHNWHHCAVVALNAVEAAETEHVPEDKRRLLLLAGLYHDYDHSAQAQAADIFNIARAIAGSSFWLGVKEPQLSQADRNEIANMIASTEASHSHTPRTLCERILIDADVLATAGEEREQWWDALAIESGAEINAESTLNFLRSQNFHSLWGMQRGAEEIGKLRTLTAAQSR